MTTYPLISTSQAVAACTDRNGTIWTIKKLNGADVNWATPPFVVNTPLGAVRFWPNMVTNPPQYDDLGTVTGHPADQQAVGDGTVSYTLTNGVSEAGPWNFSVRLQGDATPPPIPIANGTPPTISGGQSVGATMTVSDLGTWVGNAPITYAYQWRRDGVAISGATSSSYVTVSGDIGHAITCAVTGSDALPSTATAVSNAISVTPVALTNSVAPSISGVPVQGNTLTRIAGTWAGTGAISLAYQWLRDGANISGATGATYVLQAADVGHAISVKETATDAAAQTDNATSSALTVSAAGSGPGLAFFLPNSAHRARRAAIVADHFPGTGQDFEFTGFSDAELTTFSVQTAVSLVDLIAKVNALGVNATAIIECAWNGVSASASAINGPASSALTANGAVDFGYNRPGQKVLIRPAAGFTPAIRGTATNNGSDANTAFVLWGINFIEFRGLEFNATQIQFYNSATRPIAGCIAMNGNQFIDGPGDNGAMRVSRQRSVHLENNLYSGCRCGMNGGAQFMRMWNNVNIGHQDNDWWSVRNYSGYSALWRARVWCAGNMLYSPSQTTYLSATGNHLDFLQVSVTTTNVAQHDLLIEFNLCYANRPFLAGATQGTFGDDGTATGPWDWLEHNNLFLVGGNKACENFDPTDTGTKIVTRCTFSRAGNGPGSNSTGGRNDNGMYVMGYKKATGGGSHEISDCIYSVAFTNAYLAGAQGPSHMASNTTRSNNLDCDPRSGAAVGVRMQDTFRGNGTWARHPTDNLWGYDVGEQGQSPAVAKQMLRDFFEPIRGPQGSGYASAVGHVGPTDPMSWPTDFKNLT